MTKRRYGKPSDDIGCAIVVIMLAVAVGLIWWWLG